MEISNRENLKLVSLKNAIFKKLISKKQTREHKISTHMTRAFTQNDLCPVPEGWQVSRGPDFVGIAAGKAGTSWLYSLLLEHPQIVRNRLKAKELHYFPHFKHCGMSNQEAETYRMAFAAPEGSLCGEWSPGYLSHPFALEYLQAVAPSTKLLILLRNPIDRVLSMLNHKAQAIVRYYNFNPEQRYVYEAFDLNSSVIKNSLYSANLARALKIFNRNQIHVLQYECCKNNPMEEISRTYRFLGIDDNYKPQNIKRAVNRKKYSLSPLTTEERQRLAAYFADDVKALSTLFPEINLSFWPDFDNIL